MAAPARSNPDREHDAEAFVAALRGAGVRAVAVGDPSVSHADVALRLGEPGDAVGAAVFAFLRETLAPSATGTVPLRVDDVRIGDPRSAYHDPEILPGEGQMAFLDGALDVWVGTLDPATGGFRSGSGRDHRVDGPVSRWSRHSNGPEWGLDAKGPALFYVRDDERGAGQIWRAEPPWDAPRVGWLTRDPELHHWLCAPSTDPALPSTRVLVYRGRPGGPANVDAWFDEDRPAEMHPVTERMVLARFAFGTPFVTFVRSRRAGEAGPGPVARVDTTAGTSRLLTDDDGEKIDPWLWSAPEFGGETLLAVNVDGRALRLHRDVKRDGTPWSPIATLTLPPEAPHRILKSVEPVNGGRGAFGRSFFTAQAGTDHDEDTSVWLFGYDRRGSHLVRRLDEGATTGRPARRLDPESFVGERELFVYYTLVGDGPSQLRRCRTGIVAGSAAK